MKKFLIGWIVFVVLVVGAIIGYGLVADARNLWLCDALTGGTSRALDSIHSGASGLANGDPALVIPSGESRFYVFRWESGQTGPENTTTHPYVVVADNNPTSGIWVEASGMSAFAGN